MMDVVEEPISTPVNTTRLMEPMNPSPRFQSDTELGSNSPHRPTTSIINGVLRISDLSSGSVAGNQTIANLGLQMLNVFLCKKHGSHHQVW